MSAPTKALDLPAGLARLYNIPPPAACRTQPIDANRPNTPATIRPCEKLAMVLINPADPVADDCQLESPQGYGSLHGIPMTM